MKICDAATSKDAKILESVCPLEPMIVYHSGDDKPCLKVSFVNTAVGSGLFSVDGIPVHDGDTVDRLASRLLQACLTTMPAADGKRQVAGHAVSDLWPM